MRFAGSICFNVAEIASVAIGCVRGAMLLVRRIKMTAC